MLTVETPASSAALATNRLDMKGVVEQDTRWLPLMEYAAATGVSLSTLRRHIKSKKIEFRLEDGRYLLPFHGTLPHEQAARSRMDDGAGLPSGMIGIDQELMKEFETVAIEATGEIARLEAELKRSREEIAELKTLVALYEEQIFRTKPPQFVPGRR